MKESSSLRLNLAIKCRNNKIRKLLCNQKENPSTPPVQVKVISAQWTITSEADRAQAAPPAPKAARRIPEDAGRDSTRLLTGGTTLSHLRSFRSQNEPEPNWVFPSAF